MNEWLPFLGLAGLIIGLFAWLRADIHKQREELLEAMGKRRDELLEAMAKQREELLGVIQKLRDELRELRGQVQDLDRRLARVEGAIEYAFRLQGKDYPPGVEPVAQEARRIADADDPPPGPAREA